jgi:hypothetical protein
MIEFLPPLDGAELSFVYVFGFLVALWSRRLFVGPGVFLLLQYAAVWPLFMIGTKSDDIVVFLLTHAVVVWCGSVSGICVSAFIPTIRLIHYRNAEPKPIVIHISLISAAVLSMWSYPSLRGVLPLPWPTAISSAASVAVDLACWRAWTTAEMVFYFPTTRVIKWLVGSMAAVKLIVLVLFCVIDYVEECRRHTLYTILALRCIAIATITLVFVVVRISPWYWRIRDERMAHRSKQHHYLRKRYLFPKASQIGYDGSSESDKTDGDYVEYGTSLRMFELGNP